MQYQSYSISKIFLSLGIIFNLGFLPQLALAQTFASNYPLANPVSSTQDRRYEANTSERKKIRFLPVPSRGTPPATQGTGSRGNCPYKPNLPRLTPLVGSANLQLTVKEHPDFWIYVPYTTTDTSDATFSLQYEDEEIYRTSLNLPARPGIIRISLPATVSALEVDKKYRWYLDINCSEEDKANVASVTGIVQRITPSESLIEALQAALTPLEIIAAYAEHGIWYDVLSELANLRQQEPENPELEQIWQELLSDDHVGLSQIASEPIVFELTTDNQ